MYTCDCVHCYSLTRTVCYIGYEKSIALNVVLKGIVSADF